MNNRTGQRNTTPRSGGAEPAEMLPLTLRNGAASLVPQFTDKSAIPQDDEFLGWTVIA